MEMCMEMEMHYIEIEIEVKHVWQYCLNDGVLEDQDFYDSGTELSCN